MIKRQCVNHNGLRWPRYAVYMLSVTLLHFLESPTVSLVILYTMPEHRARVTLKHDGTDGTDGTSNCFEEDVRIGLWVKSGSAGVRE